jgi:hypothetical protein
MDNQPIVVTVNPDKPNEGSNYTSMQEAFDNHCNDENTTIVISPGTYINGVKVEKG